MVWSQLSFHLHKKQTSYIFENFKPSQIIFSMFPIFSWHFVYFADQMIFFLNSSSSKTGRMFTLHKIIRSYKIYLVAKFQPDYVIFVCFTD